MDVDTPLDVAASDAIIVNIPPMPTLHTLSLEGMGSQTLSMAFAMLGFNLLECTQIRRVQVHVLYSTDDLDAWIVLNEAFLRWRSFRRHDMSLFINRCPRWRRRRRAGLWLDWIAKGQMTARHVDVLIILDLFN